MKQKIIYTLISSIIFCMFFFALFSYLSALNPKQNMFAAMNSKTSGPLHSFLNVFPFFQQPSEPVIQTTITKQTKTIYETQSTGSESASTNSENTKNNTELQGGLIGQGVAEFDNGIITNGANINLGNGEIKASNVLYGVQSGTGTQVTDGQWPTINNTGVLSLQGDTGNLNLTAGSGIGIAGLTITNDDLGSSQNIFKNIVVGQTTITAGSNNDTLSFISGTGISLSTATNPT